MATRNPESARTSLYTASVQRALPPKVPQSPPPGEGTVGNMPFTTAPESVPQLGTSTAWVRPPLPRGPRELERKGPKLSSEQPQALAKGPPAQPDNQLPPQSPDPILTLPDRSKRLLTGKGGSKAPRVNAGQSSRYVTTDTRLSSSASTSQPPSNRQKRNLSYSELGKPPIPPSVAPRRGHVGGLGIGPQNSAGVGDVSNIIAKPSTGGPYAHSRRATASIADANQSLTIHAPTPVRAPQIDKAGKPDTVRLLEEQAQKMTDQGAATS